LGEHGLHIACIVRLDKLIKLEVGLHLYPFSLCFSKAR
jgi:hypothetical protein